MPSRVRRSGSSRAFPRPAFWRQSWTARPATGKETTRGKRYAAPQAPPASACSRSRPAGEAQGKTGQAPELGGPAFLRATASPREVGLRAARARLRDRLRDLRRRLGLNRNQRRAPELLFEELVKRLLRIVTAKESRAEPAAGEAVARPRDEARGG